MDNGTGPDENYFRRHARQDRQRRRMGDPHNDNKSDVDPVEEREDDDENCHTVNEPEK